MGKTYRKTISLSLFLAILIWMLPAAAFAANNTLPATVQLKAGSEIVGQVYVQALDSENIRVTYSIDPSKAWSPTHTNGLVFQSIRFDAYDGNNRGYHCTFTISSTSPVGTTSYSFDQYTNPQTLSSFTATAEVVNVQPGPNPISKTVTMVSGIDDNVGSGNGQLVYINATDPLPKAWNRDDKLGGTADQNTRTMIGSLQDANAKWIWKSAQVAAPVTGEFYDYSRNFSIPADATGISGTLEVVCDNGYIVQLNQKYAFSDDFHASSYLSRSGVTLPPGSSDVDKINYCFSNLTATDQHNTPLFKENVVPSAGWTTALPLQYITSLLKNGDNILEVKAMNEYMNIDDTLADGVTHQKEGTVTSNPAGLLYRMILNYSVPAYITTGMPYTATAQWPTYKVIYDGNGSDGGIVPSDSNDYPENAGVKVLGPGTMSRNGFSFEGWNLKQDGSGTMYQPDNRFIMGTADVKLWAQWKPDQVYYTVTFETYGGQPVPDQQKVLSGDPATKPATDPSRNSDRFGGWFLDEEFNNAYNFSTLVTHDITLYAKFTSTDPGGESFPLFSALPSFFEMFGN